LLFNQIIIMSQNHTDQVPESQAQESLAQESQTQENKTPKNKAPKDKAPKSQIHESANLKALIESLKEHPEPEKKLELVIKFMADALAQTGSPHFRDFWEAKKLCQALFRENINSTARVHLWT